MSIKYRGNLLESEQFSYITSNGQYNGQPTN